MTSKDIVLKECLYCKCYIDPDYYDNGNKRKSPIGPLRYLTIKFCSHRCEYRYKAEHRPNLTGRKCIVCHRKFDKFLNSDGTTRSRPLTKYKYVRLIYCSHECSHKGKRIKLALKKCLLCKKTIKPCAPWKYKRQKYCSVECRNKANSITPPVRFCSMCGNELIRRKGERLCHFIKRRFCCRRCASDYLIYSIEDGRCCQSCGKTLHRKIYTNADKTTEPEPRYWYRHRKFCNIECANAFKRDKANVERETKERGIWWSRDNVNFVAKPFVKNRTVIPSKEVAVSINECSATERATSTISTELGHHAIRNINASSVEALILDEDGDIE
jgi:hypothetical protein